MSNWKQAINHKQYIQQLEFHQKVIDNIAPSLEHLIKAKLVFDKLGLEMIKKVKEFDKWLMFDIVKFDWMKKHYKTRKVRHKRLLEKGTNKKETIPLKWKNNNYYKFSNFI